MSGGHKPSHGPNDQLWDRPGRLIGILWQLAQAGDVGLTVRELQLFYGVSGRQIGRDLLTLENARIPLVYHTRGTGHAAARWSLRTRDRVIAEELARLTGTAPLSIDPPNLRRLTA